MDKPDQGNKLVSLSMGNLGFVYQRLNRIELSIIHYKISLGLLKNLKHT